MKDTLLIIPAYNEEKNIEDVLENIKKSGALNFADIMVVNDGSKDNTKEVVESLGVKVISQIYNLGYGAALQISYKYAMEHGYEYVIQMDADGQHDVCNIENIHNCMMYGDESQRPDIVIGSRFLEGAKHYHMSAIRLLAVKMFRTIIKIVTHQKITDPTSGLQGLNSRAFTYYAGYGNFDIKYPDINMIIQMLLLGFKIKEVPAIMHARYQGQSMHAGIIKPLKYMCIMMLSVLVAILRNRGKKQK